MTAPLEKIERLIKLASNNPNEEEARTAGREACKLIVKHKLVVREEEPWDDLGITRDDVERAFHESAAQVVQVVQEVEPGWRVVAPFAALLDFLGFEVCSVMGSHLIVRVRRTGMTVQGSLDQIAKLVTTGKMGDVARGAGGMTPTDIEVVSAVVAGEKP